MEESHSREVTPEEMRIAAERYPGLPLTLAVTRYMIDKVMDIPIGPLNAGLGWGGVHLETAGRLVQKLANAMYKQGKKGLTITIESEDFPESWDHLWIEIKEVDSGPAEDQERMGLGGWPCCACDEVIAGTDRKASAFMIHKKASWQYPTWGNVLHGTADLAVAALCGNCFEHEATPLYAIKALDSNGERPRQFVRVPISELEEVEVAG